MAIIKIIISIVRRQIRNKQLQLIPYNPNNSLKKKLNCLIHKRFQKHQAENRQLMLKINQKMKFQRIQ
jgi:hypothetical protein